MTNTKNLENKIQLIISNIELNADVAISAEDLENITNSKDELESVMLDGLTVVDSKEYRNLFLLISDWKEKNITKDELAKEIIKVLKEYKDNNSIEDVKGIKLHIFYRVKNIETKVKRDNIIYSLNGKRRVFDKLTEIKKESELKSALKGIKFYFICDTPKTKEKIELSEIRRFDILNMPEPAYYMCSDTVEDNDLAIEGHVLTVPLVQIVKIYNTVGDNLFKHNVRYGIEDVLGVDDAIINTLDTCPNTFWFKNNGITIIVNDKNFALDKSSKITLFNGAGKGDIKFSVVNGAQTITAASKYYYELVSKNTDEAKKKKEKYEKEAKVLLRIIVVKDSKDNSNNEVGEISVALNRQKPILAEDIAYTSSQIQDLQELINSKGEICDFDIVKRGQELDKSRSITLEELARAVMADRNLPGTARNTVSSKLLKQTEDKKLLNFNDWRKESILPANASMEKELEVFEKEYYKDYKWISFINKAIKTCNEVINTEKGASLATKGDSDAQQILMNGKWYFVCTLLSITKMVTESDKTCTQFTTQEKKRNEDLLKKSNLEKAMRNYASVLAELIHNDDFIKIAKDNKVDISKIDSNLFKKDDLYKLLCNKKDEKCIKEAWDKWSKSGKEEKENSSAVSHIKVEYSETEEKSEDIDKAKATI